MTVISAQYGVNFSGKPRPMAAFVPVKSSAPVADEVLMQNLKNPDKVDQALATVRHRATHTTEKPLAGFYAQLERKAREIHSAVKKGDLGILYKHLKDAAQATKVWVPRSVFPKKAAKVYA